MTLTLTYVVGDIILNNFFPYMLTSPGFSFWDIHKKLWSVGGGG